MSENPRHAALIDDLVDTLRPVHPLAPPVIRTLAWLAAVLLLAVTLMSVAGMDELHMQLTTLDLQLSAVGAGLTAVTAAFAAFVTSVPGRSLRWTLLPLVPALLWIGASGIGCLRGWITPDTDLADAHDMEGCFAFLVAVSLPLSMLLVLMLRRACPLYPSLTAALGGLAAAAAAAVLLVPFHPHDTTATDLVIHAVAVLGVVGVHRLAGRWLMASGRS